MKPQGAHANEDRLLDLAYGELPPSEARLMEQHVQGCSRCSEALDGIRGVRTAMSLLPRESAPEAGLESLMAYAQQAARRSAVGPEVAPRWWRRLLAPALGVAAMSVFGVVVLQVNREVDLSPALKKEAAREQLAYQEGIGSPAMPAAPTAAPLPPTAQRIHTQLDEEIRAAPMPTKQPPKPVRRSERADWSNAGAGSAGGFPDKKNVSYEESSKSKRGMASFGKTKPSMMAQRAEPDGDEVAAEAAEGLAADAPIPGESQVAQYADVPDSMSRLSGSASRPARVASVAFEDDAQRAPGRAQVASAAPPPPAAQAQHQYPPSEPTAGPFARAEEREAKKAEMAPEPSGKSTAARISPSPAELLRQADVAYRSGDRVQEVAFLRAALAAGVRGARQLDVLSRLCEAEFELGHRRNAIDICRRVMREAPGSNEARIAQRRLESELQSPAEEADGELEPASPEAR